MNYPSIKTIQTRLRIARPIAIAVRMEMRETSYPADDRLQAINGLLGTHGVETAFGQSAYGRDALSYCNTGETYQTTVCYDYLKCRFLISSWGDIVERNEKRFADR